MDTNNIDGKRLESNWLRAMQPFEKHSAKLRNIMLIPQRMEQLWLGNEKNMKTNHVLHFKGNLNIA